MSRWRMTTADVKHTLDAVQAAVKAELAETRVPAQ